MPVVILLLMALLVAVVAGCGGAHYDGRLVAADSLIRSNPDSALAVLEALPTASLTTEGDRAYHGLLLAQARYKAYVVATSDSDINRALNYYRAHSREREKLTRAYIYKGAVMEELGHPDSAMLYYKHAEATADEKDYVNLGQIKTRIADLYRLQYADIQICYDKYKEALYYHKLTNNKRLQIDCLFSMAGCSGITGLDNSNELLYQASNMAKQENDSFYYYKCQELLCRQLAMKDTTLLQAKQIATNCLENYGSFVNNDLLLDLAYIYAKENSNDSSLLFLGFVNEQATDGHQNQIRVRKYQTLSMIAMNTGDSLLSHMYMDSCNQIVTAIESNQHKYTIQSIENNHNKNIKESNRRTIRSMKWLVWGLIATLFVLALSFIYYFHHKNRYIKSIIKELNESTDINRHEQMLQQLDTKESIIYQFVQNLTQFMQTSIDASEKDSPSVIRRRINELIGNVTTDEFWNALRDYIDRKYVNLITDIAKKPAITDIDLRFIELCCLGFDYIEIAITLKVSPNYVSTKRKAIARKLGLRIPLQDYLEREMKIREKA